MLCDGLAKEYWNFCALSDSWLPSQEFRNENWSIRIDDRKLSWIDKDKLYLFTFADHTKWYW